MTTLFIVESPGKIKKICAALGKSYVGEASFGHIMDLAENSMSIDFENNFNPIYVIPENKKKVVASLIKAAKKAKDVLIATDKDREGEMIGWNIAQILKLKNPKRIVFTDVQKKSVKDAVKNVGTIDLNVVYSQQGRRVLDRIIGYGLSPILDGFFESHNLSAGRVQSVVCRLIVDRENEIEKFFSKDNVNSHFHFEGIFYIPNTKNQQFKSQMFVKKLPLTSKPFKGELLKIPTEAEAKELLTMLMEALYKIQNVFAKKRMQSASPPYTTSSMQQDASHKFNFNGQRTMLAAQHLYEAGYITYMRTDSIILSDEALLNIEKYILENYDAKYYKKNIYKVNDKAQAAHECIRPTEIYTTTLVENGKIQQDEIKLYNLIWRRTVASQMSQAEYNDLNIQISISNLNKYYFSTCIASLVFDGFLILHKSVNYDEEIEDNEEDNEPKKSKINGALFTENTELDTINIKSIQEYQKPPFRYNYASILNILDDRHLNIGRPATIASLIPKLLLKKYVIVKDTKGKTFDSLCLSWTKQENDNQIITTSNIITLSKEKSKLTPTKLGIMITNYLTLHFEKIMDYQFTAKMEKNLDEIANGNLIWHKVIKEFYDEFNPLIMSRVNVNNINKGKDLKLLGEHNNKEIYVTTTKYGPAIKYVDGLNAKFLKIVEPLTIETITLDEAIKVIETIGGYPKLIGLFERKKILLKINNGSHYIAYDKKNFPSDKADLTLEEAIKIIKSSGKIALVRFENEQKVVSVYQGKENKYINIINKKTKKTYNVPLPDDEIIKDLTFDKINKIINNAYNKK